MNADDRARIAAFGIDLPDLWERIENSERKAMLRLVIDKVILDQRRAKGMVWIRIIWQTGAATEHWVMRRTQSYAEAAHADVLEQRIRELNAAGMMDAEVATALNTEGLRNSLDGLFDHNTVHLLRQRWNIPTVKINGVEHNPPRWPDGSYSIQGAATALGVTEQTVFKWLKRGKLQGRQLKKGQPWQVDLTLQQIKALTAPNYSMTPSRKAAS